MSFGKVVFWKEIVLFIRLFIFGSRILIAVIRRSLFYLDVFIYNNIYMGFFFRILRS